MYQLTDFLPTTVKEMRLHGWDNVDGAFQWRRHVDHPAFGPAVVGQWCRPKVCGWRRATTRWQDDLRDFKSLVYQNCFCRINRQYGQHVNHYTNKRLRSMMHIQQAVKLINVLITRQYLLQYLKLYLMCRCHWALKASLRQWRTTIIGRINWCRAFWWTTKPICLFGMGEKPLKAVITELKKDEK